MRKYFVLNLKRLTKVLPYIFATVLLLFSCMFLAFHTAIKAAEGKGQVRFRLALVCGDDPYFQTGLDVIQAYDSTRFAIETLHLDEEKARDALNRGELDAYVVIPDGYIRDAMNGKLGELQYVSTTGAVELTTLFKDEITGVVSDIIISCEKAMYGVERIDEDYALENGAGAYTGQISMKYVELLLDRTDMYYVDALGVRDSLGFDGYLFAGIVVLLCAVMLIPACVSFIKPELSLNRLLRSKGIGAGMQVVGEYLAFITILFIPMAFLSLGVVLIGSAIPAELMRLITVFQPDNFIFLFIVLLNAAAFAYLFFQLADELVGGILLYFFASLALCFVSGCIYPTYFFPDLLRNVSQFTPQGLSRTIIGSCIIGNVRYTDLFLLSVYTVVLLAAAYVIRLVRLNSAKG